MKRLLSILLASILSIGLHAQSVMLNDVTRANAPSSRNTANALDVMKPYTASGTDTYTVSILSGTLYSGSATYVDGDMFTIVFTNANTSTTPTLNINSEGALAIKNNDGTDPEVGAIAGALKLRYNGTHLRVVGSTGGGGGLSSVDWGDITGTLSDQTDLLSALNGKQTLDSDLTTIAGLSPSNDDFLQFKSSAWANRTLSQVRTDLALIAASITNGVTTSAPNQDQVFDALALKRDIANTASALTDGSSITITGTKHTLTTTQSTITFSDSFTGDFTNIDVTFNNTAATWTFPSGSLCVVEGSASGDNTATISATSGDKIVISIWFVSSSNYRVVIKNFGQ